MPRLLASSLQAIKVRHRSKLRIDTLKVGNVIAEIDLRRRIKRRNPDRVNAEILQIVKMLRDSVEVADSIAVGIAETARIDLVNDRMPPPALIRCRSISSGSMPTRPKKASESANEARQMRFITSSYGTLPTERAAGRRRRIALLYSAPENRIQFVVIS